MNRWGNDEATGASRSSARPGVSLLPGERVLRESPSPVQLVLTTHRIRLERRSSGLAELTSIMLDELASCALTRTSQPILLVLAAACLVLGLIYTAGAGEGFVLLIGLIGGAIFGALYLGSRQQTLVLSSAGASIKANTKGMSFEAVQQIIDEIEAAKDARYRLLTGGGQA